jgi:hypothetical protein
VFPARRARKVAAEQSLNDHGRDRRSAPENGEILPFHRTGDGGDDSGDERKKSRQRAIAEAHAAPSVCLSLGAF